MVNISPQSFSIFSECLSDQVATESSNGQQSAPAAGRRRDIGFPIKSRGFSKNIGISLYPYAPWCWYIYLQNWVIFGLEMGKRTPRGFKKKNVLASYGKLWLTGGKYLEIISTVVQAP